MTLNNRLFKGQGEVKLLCRTVPVWIFVLAALKILLGACVKIYFCLFLMHSHLCKQNTGVCLVLFFYFAFCLQSRRTHTGTPRPFVSVSNLRAHTSRRRFHLRRPTVFLLDDTVAPTDKLQHRDISDISKNLTFMGLVFLSHFAWNLFSFQCPCITPDACQKKLEVLSELF